MSRKTTIQGYLWIVKEEMVQGNSGTSSKRKFRLHPLIYSFSSEKDATTCGDGSERAKVCIKVCHLQSRGPAWASDHHAYAKTRIIQVW